MNIKQYLTYQNLFQINTAFISPGEKLFFLASVILLLLAAALKIAAVLAPNPVDAKIRQKFYHLFLTMGIGGVIWYFCRYEDAWFFGTRFVILAWMLIGAVWFLAILASIFKNYKKEKKVWEKEQVKLKYLPK